MKRMKRMISIAALAFAVVNAAFAKDTLAILPFTGGQGEEGETIAELFSFEKELTAVFAPVPRTSINGAIRSEQRFQMASGMTDPDTIAALGKQLGAQYVVAGSITSLGKQNLLIIAIIKIDELRQIAGDVQTYGSISEIRGKLPAMAKTIADASKGGAANLPMLAVLPVRLSGWTDTREADALAQILAARLAQSGKYAVYPRTKGLEQVQAEIGNQFGGDVADEYLPRIGKANNPRLALSVTARKLGVDTMFNAAIINLETGIQEAGETADYQSMEDGIRAMEDLSAVLSGGAVPVRTASGGSEWKVADEKGFKQAIAEINAAGKGEYIITLTGSFFSDPVSFSLNAAKTITLKGEASERIISNKGDKPFFTVPGTVTLVLDQNLTLYGNNKKARLVRLEGGGLIMKAGAALRGSAGGGVYVNSGGSFTMSGGTISGNMIIDDSDDSGRGGDGGGVNVSSGSFTMSGGTISDNSANGDRWDSNGGGVYVSSGNFSMSGGTISGNSARSDGGGVNVSSFTMSGGTISDNSSAYRGGGVYVSGSFSMGGGMISGNSASLCGGGGVYVSSGNFSMSGGTISRNSASDDSDSDHFDTIRGGGGGVYVYNYGSFTMSGGTISGNSAIGYDGIGGGVLVKSGSFSMGGGTISGNSAIGNSDYDGCGGGVGVIDMGDFSMSGGMISGNSARDDRDDKEDFSRGGGVYIFSEWFVKTGGTIDGTNMAREGMVVSVYDGNYKPSRVRNSAAGPNVNMDSDVYGSTGGWE
ncbi:MAG: hypothetical protein LBP19_08935 [Treponema sp.]|jgi:hypothetical protein|nr:hypothetical protein [Treponema sp.]